MPRATQTTKLERARTLVAGIQKHLAAGGKYYLQGRAFSRDDLIATFQEELDALRAIQAARAALASAVAREVDVERRVRSLELDLKGLVQNLFGHRIDVLGAFGWSVPKKPGPKTPAAKALGAEKAAATRKARGTMGKRQRLKVRGTL